MGACEGHQNPGGQGHGGDVRVGVGVGEGGDRVGEGRPRGGARQVQGDEELDGDAGGGDGQRDAQAAHAAGVGVDDPGRSDREDDERVGEDREGLGELAGRRAGVGSGGGQEQVEAERAAGGARIDVRGQWAGGAQPGPGDEGQGESDAEDGLDILQAQRGARRGRIDGVASGSDHARSSFPPVDRPGGSLVGAAVGGMCPGCGCETESALVLDGSDGWKWSA